MNATTRTVTTFTASRDEWAAVIAALRERGHNDLARRLEDWIEYGHERLFDRSAITASVIAADWIRQAAADAGVEVVG